MSNMHTDDRDDLVIVLSTFPSMEVAESLSYKMVEEGLAACVNLIQTKSIFKWKGEREDVDEVLMIAKSRRGLCNKLKEHLSGSHPYETPEIVILEPIDVDEGYLKWVLESTAGGFLR